MTRADAADPRLAVRGGIRRVPATVWALGLTSLLTDVSSEMIVSILPAYLVLTSGFAPMLLGVATGLHEGGPVLASWIGGWIADRSGQRKRTAAAGYALSALCRLGWLLLPPRTAGVLAALVVSDRFGKAIRTAPRDALISLSVPRPQLATAFGVHRALDAAGAALGPALAFFLLWRFPQRFDIIFFTAFIVALLGLAALMLLVDERSAAHAPESVTAASPSTDRISGTPHVWSHVRAALRDTGLRRLMAFGGAFGLLSIGDAFVYVLLVRHAQAPAHWLPLFYSGTALMFLTFAVPMGALADRVGRWRVYVWGYAPLALAYGLALVPGSIAIAAWPWNALVCVALLGLFYASTDGVLAGLAGARLPEDVRATGLALVATIISLGRLGGAMLFGLLWTRAGDRLALIVFIAALVSLITASALAPRASRPEAA